MDELKLTGNCLLGSRPLLSFDSVRVCGENTVYSQSSVMEKVDDECLPL